MTLLHIIDRSGRARWQQIREPGLEIAAECPYIITRIGHQMVEFMT
jgi:hypothetical protein